MARGPASRVMWAILMAGTVVAGVLLVAPARQAAAASCPRASVGGASIGHIAVSGIRAPITPVTSDVNGDLSPPATNRAVGLSTEHAGLNSARGTSVLVWHVRYGKGCPGSLNPMLTLPLGATFIVTSRGGAPREYRIVERVTVRKGDYRPEWFDPTGPRRLALFTCTDLRAGEFRKTIAILAEPV